MNSRLTAVLFSLAMSSTLPAISQKSKIDKCFLSFVGSDSLSPIKPQRLPEDAEKTRSLETESGDVSISCIDGYRILYMNTKEVPFVNLKVELSADSEYDADQKKILDNLNYLNAHSSGMETKELTQLTYNGFKIVGLSRGGIEVGSTLGTFVLFAGNGVTVYFYFNNLKPKYRNFSTVEDYKNQRNRFFEQYTNFIKSCTKESL